MKRALVERFGDEILGEDGAPDRERIALRVFSDREALDFLEKLLHPLVSREYLTWREQLAALPRPAPGLRHGGAAPLRGRRRDALRQGRRGHGAAEAARGAGAGRADDREARLLPDREKVKRADFSYVNTGTPEELDAWVGGVMAALAPSDGDAVVSHGALASRRRSVRGSASRAVAAWRRRGRARTGTCGPLPARVRADRPRPRRQLRPRPGAPRGRHLRGEPVRPERALRGGRGRAHAAPAGHGQGDRAAHRRATKFVVADLTRPGDQRPLRLVVPRPPARPLRRRAHGARRVPRGPGQRRRVAPARRGIEFPETRTYVDEVERVRKVYATAYADELGLP